MSRGLTTEEFIQKAKATHKDKYNYDKTIYTKATDKVIITCPIHGDFEQKASNHLSGQGCPKCSGIQRKTTAEFINDVRKIHGNKYDYSKVNYINNHTKVCIICPEHGEFWQLPQDHLQKKAGCPKCATIELHNKQRKSTEDFIKEANQVHHYKYDYSKADYKGSHTNITIICPKHGEFQQLPTNHLKGCGCPKCNNSKGELKVEHYLQNHNIEYISQYEIEYLGNKTRKTRIDFYLPKLNMAIEYNGIQHYVPQKYFGGEIKFNKQVERDTFVRNYCLNHNMQLIEISDIDKVDTTLSKYIR